MARRGVTGGAPRHAVVLLALILLLASCTVVDTARELDRISMQAAPVETAPVESEDPEPVEPPAAPDAPEEPVSEAVTEEDTDPLPEGFQTWTLDEKLAYLESLAEPVEEEPEEAVPETPREVPLEAFAIPTAETVPAVPADGVAPPPASSVEPSAVDMEGALYDPASIIRLGPNVILPRWFVVWTFVLCFAILFTLCFIARQNRWSRWGRGRD